MQTLYITHEYWGLEGRAGKEVVMRGEYDRSTLNECMKIT
jgi:hypothetical protein